MKSLAQWVVAALLLLCLSPALAQDAPPCPENAPEASAEAPAMPAVPAALRGMKFLRGTPDLKAKVYMYLQSASWCGPCRRAMPVITKAYPEMKAAGIEIILCCCDHSEEDSIAYAESHGVTFPVIWKNAPDLSKLPGYKNACGIPHIIVVSADGEVVKHCHPYYLFREDEWKQLVENHS